MEAFGLLGRSLGHSFSPRIHNLLGDYPYGLFEVEPEDLRAFLARRDFSGLNVTIPYKQAVIPHLDELTPQAAKLGAVNTVVRRPDGTLLGHNSDHYGFSSLIKRSGCCVAGKKVLVLGSGGASKPVMAVLQELGAHGIIISRGGENHYGNLDRHADAALIVNTTPVGMYPDTGASPLSLDLFPHLEAALDVIYNPARTRLLMEAKSRGLIAQNGLWMLVAQAKESAELFLGTPIDDSRIHAIYRQLRWETENIILIGMPGCGKTTVGRLVAEKLGRPFVDTDAQVEALAGCSIPELFSKDGEAAFRRYESQVLSQYGKSSGLVIATGGGCVIKEENYPHLHQNGRIFWLTRSLDKLPADGRPLSQQNSLEALFAQRKPFYEAFADRVISNDGTPSDAVTALLRSYERG